MSEKAKEQCVPFFKGREILHRVLFSSTKLMRCVQNERVVRYDHFFLQLNFKSNLTSKYCVFNSTAKLVVSGFINLLVDV